MVSSDGSEPEGMYLVLLRSDQEYVTVMAIEVLDDVQEPTGLSIPTAIAGDWIKNPFTTALPIVEEDSNVKMDVMSQDPIVLVTISFDEDMKEFDKEQLDSTVLRLRTIPSLSFSWTATEVQKRNFTLELAFNQPELVSMDTDESPDLTKLQVQFVDPQFFVDEANTKSLVAKR